VYTRLWVRANIFCCDRNRALLKSSIVIEKKKKSKFRFSWLQKIETTHKTTGKNCGAKNLGILLQILQNVIEKSFINWRVLSLVKINTRISKTPCMYL
jgi:hypothetical protein